MVAFLTHNFVKLFLLLTLTITFIACNPEEEDPNENMNFPETNSSYNSEATTASTDSSTTTATTSSGAGELVKVIQKENPYIFEPETIDWTLNKTYTLEFTDVNEFHTFNVDELGIEVYVNAGETVTQDVTPSVAGSFKLYCVPHESLGMVGTINVA
ncbi:MAG: plastocyanin/azurin family copper-binding protein [Dehalococcoidia bacterium]|jgi:plastocyanin